MWVLALNHAMEPPRDSTELSYFIDSYLVQSENGELFKGSLLANFKDKSNAEFCEFLRDFYGARWSDSFISPVLASVRRLKKTVKDKSKTIFRPTTQESIAALLNEPYSLPVKRKREDSESSTPSTPSSSNLSDSEFSTPKRSRTCFECGVLKNETLRLGKEVAELTEKNKTLEAKVDVKFKNEPRVLNQTIKRLKGYRQSVRAAKKTMRKAEEKEKKANAKVEPLKTKIQNLQVQIRALKDQKAHTKSYHSKKNSDSVLSKKLKVAELEIKSLKEKLCDTENRVLELEEKLSDSIETMDGRQYDIKTRKCINYCTQKNVSHENASELVRYVVSEMTGKTLEKLPAPSTNANIAREFGVISDIHCGVVMSESTNVTFGWDGTTKGGMHLNEKNLSTSSGTLTLGVSEIGGGKAVDYAEDIRNVFTDVTNRYSACFNRDPTDTNKKLHDGKKTFKGKIISNIQSLLINGHFIVHIVTCHLYKGSCFRWHEDKWRA